MRFLKVEWKRKDRKGVIDQERNKVSEPKRKKARKTKKYERSAKGWKKIEGDKRKMKT